MKKLHGQITLPNKIGVALMVANINYKQVVTASAYEKEKHAPSY